MAIQILGGTIAIMTMPFALSGTNPQRPYFVGAAKLVLLAANYLVGIGLHWLVTRMQKRDRD